MNRYFEKFNFNAKEYESETEMLSLYLKKVERDEQYYFIEKNQGKMYCYYDEEINDYSRYLTDIIEIINKKNQLKALRLGLKKLPADKKVYIEEYFFYDSYKQPTLNELSAKHKISRQSYKKNLQNSLKVLSELVLEIYEEF